MEKKKTDVQAQAALFLFFGRVFSAAGCERPVGSGPCGRAGRVASGGSATYSASKYAVEGLTDALRREVVDASARMTEVTRYEHVEEAGVGGEAEEECGPAAVGEALSYLATQAPHS